jgi:predicted glycogen debranching enzyme
LVALPGLLLGTRRPEIARDYLCAAVETWSRTWLPKAFQAKDSVYPSTALDGPLWLFPAAWHYWTATHDRAFLGDELYPALESIAREYGERYVCRGRTDNLICARDARQSDMPGSICLTTNALWYNAQEALAEWALIMNNGGQKAWGEASARTRAGVLNVFLSQDGSTLLNAISESGEWRDQALRSSQSLAVGLPFSVLPDSGPVLARMRDELATPVGLRSLSPRDPAYVGDGSDIRFLPRRWSGSVDPTYFGVYCDALIRAGMELDIKEVFAPLQKVFTERGYGCLPGAFSGDAPHTSCDHVASACAVGEALRIYLRLTGIGTI